MVEGAVDGDMVLVIDSKTRAEWAGVYISTPVLTPEPVLVDAQGNVWLLAALEAKEFTYHSGEHRKRFGTQLLGRVGPRPTSSQQVVEDQRDWWPVMVQYNKGVQV